LGEVKRGTEYVIESEREIQREDREGQGERERVKASGFRDLTAMDSSMRCWFCSASSVPCTFESFRVSIEHVRVSMITFQKAAGQVK